MTDPAIASHPKSVTALAEWSKFSTVNEGGRKARIEYVERELKRLASEGISPLYAAVTFPLSDQQTDAFAALTKMGLRSFFVRLVQGCKPPHTDSQGRELPDDERGKCLAAKVGVVQYDNGDQRAAAARRDLDIHHHAKITADPQPLSLEDAIVVMRQWGYNVRPKRAARRDSEGREIPRRDEWLVVHVQPNGQPYAPPISPESAPKRRAGSPAEAEK